MTKEEIQDAKKVALAFVKYRSGQIHLFGFKDHAGISLSDAIKEHPWILDCNETKDIAKVFEKWNGT